MHPSWKQERTENQFLNGVLSKAMSILGFSSAQTFESTHMDEIKKNFIYKMNMLMKLPGKNSKKTYTERKAEARRTELRKINEAMQFLQKKRSKKEKVLQDWRNEKKQIIMLSKTIDALALDDGLVSDEQKAEYNRQRLLKKTETRRAQA